MNGLKGTLADSLVELDALTWLDLSDNHQLSGRLPPLPFASYTGWCDLHGIGFTCPLPAGAESCGGEQGPRCTPAPPAPTPAERGA